MDSFSLMEDIDSHRLLTSLYQGRVQFCFDVNDEREHGQL